MSCSIGCVMIRVLQITCIALATAVLYGINWAVDGIGNFLGGSFDAGFVMGICFAALLYLAICWIDPSSRPRGSGVQKQGFDNRVD